MTILTHNLSHLDAFAWRDFVGSRRISLRLLHLVFGDVISGWTILSFNFDWKLHMESLVIPFAQLIYPIQFVFLALNVANLRNFAMIFIKFVRATHSTLSNCWLIEFGVLLSASNACVCVVRTRVKVHIHNVLHAQNTQHSSDGNLCFESLLISILRWTHREPMLVSFYWQNPSTPYLCRYWLGIGIDTQFVLSRIFFLLFCCFFSFVSFSSFSSHAILLKLIWSV